MKIRVKALLGDSVTSTVCDTAEELEVFINKNCSSSSFFRMEDISDQAVNETLTKREQFAMAAMQGYLSGTLSWSHPDHEEVAREAVRYADALIKELDK